MPNRVSALIVEDSRTDAKLIGTQLGVWGYTVDSDCVADAVALRASLAGRRWDVVISDWSIPGFGGREALAILQETGLDVPFIIVSGVADDEVAVEAMRQGAHDYVCKDNLARLGGAVQREVRQARLRQEHAKQRALDERFFELAPDLLCVADFDGKLVRGNPAWQSTLGWSAEHLRSESPLDLIHPDERVADAERRARFATADCATLSWQGRYLHKDGSYRDLEWTATPFARERLVYAAARDVTERKRSEDALRLSQARFKRLADSGIVAIAIADVLGNLHEVNDAYAEILGYSRDELLSGAANWAAQTPPEWRASDEAMVERLRETGVAPPWEKELFRKDGSRVPVLIGVAMLDYPNCIAFMLDLTARKRVEESLRQSESLLRHAQKMEALGQLAAGVAHEINTPAQFITDNLVFLEEAFGSVVSATRSAIPGFGRASGDNDLQFVIDQVPRALAQSLDGIRRVSSIVAAMKSFSHPSSARMTPTDLREVIQTSLTMARNRWKYVAEVHTDFDPLLPHVSCLRDELSQVILNLVVNAADAISERTDAGARGKGTISVAARTVGECAEIRIADDGAGIPEQIRRHIFEPFFTTKTVGKGSGQGLAIAHAIIVDKHSGQISFEPTQGGGTTFVIRLPIVPAAQAIPVSS